MTKQYKKGLCLLMIMVLTLSSISFTQSLDETVPPSTDQVIIQEDISVPNYEDLTVESEDTSNDTGSNSGSSGSSSGSSNTSNPTSDDEDDNDSDDDVVIDSPVEPEDLENQLTEAETSEEATAILNSVSDSLSESIDGGVDEEVKEQVVNLTEQVSNIIDNDLMDAEKSTEIVKKVIDENLSKVNNDVTTTEKDKVELRKMAKSLADKVVEKSGEVQLDEDGQINQESIEKALLAVDQTVKDLEESLEKNQLKEPGEEIIEKKVTVTGDIQSLSLDLETIDTLSKASMGLSVKSNGMALDLDAETLKTIGQKSIEVKSEPVSEESNTQLQEKAGTDYKVLKTNDVDISATSDDGSTEQVTNIRIKIDVSDYEGNKDQLSVIIFNEETESFEMVKSWVVDDQLVLKSPHYSLYSVAEYNNNFTDIEGHWGADKIVKMTAKGITNGYSKTSFKPDGDITRAEFIKLLVVAFDLESEGKNIFADIQSDDWYTSYINIALKNGLLNHITGIEGLNFNPNDQITREDMMILLASLYDLKTGNDMKIDEVYFDDLSEATVIGQKSINGAKDLNLVQGYEDGSFRPKGTATRAEAMEILDNLMSLLN